LTQKGNKDSTYLRFKIAEIFACRKLRAILTSKYPPEILDTEFFEELPPEDKEFLKKYWTTFDILKPVFEVKNEIPNYIGFILYEVKSLILTKENKSKTIANPRINISLNQKRLFDECTKKNIPVKIFIIFFLENWEIEYKEYDYENVSTYVNPHSAWQEDKMKRIKSSKLNQFWHDLFPNYILYKADEEKLAKEQENTYIKDIISTPLSDEEKKLLVVRAKKMGRKIPDFEDTAEKMYIRKKQGREDRELKKIQEKYPNHGKPWREEEDKELYNLHLQGKTSSEIASILKRTSWAIICRLKIKGLLDEKI